MTAGTRGGVLNTVSGLIPMSHAVLSAVSDSENCFTLNIRWLENCRTWKLRLRFSGASLEMTSIQQAVGGFDRAPFTAEAVLAGSLIP